MPTGDPENTAKHRTLFPCSLEKETGQVWLVLDPASFRDGRLPGEWGRYLYVDGIHGGLGSNPIGLDRGRIGRTRLVAFRRVGHRFLIEEINLKFRALETEAAETEATTNSFARSVLWSGEIKPGHRGNHDRVNLTSFFIRDAIGAAQAMESTDQGNFQLDPSRSYVDLPACLFFPDNMELQTVLTFEGTKPGEQVRSVAAAPEAVTLVQHQSFIRLPDDGFRTREYDPRSGAYALEYMDFATSLEQPLIKRMAVRHRLQKTAAGEIREPLVYYLDRGAPEPIRSALLEGGRWWEQAFAAAGFPGAFEVKLLPEGVHPQDVRYNVIAWVHRQTRGWSFGQTVTDPRTGEIIKGQVILGSQRVRQDRLIFEALLGEKQTGSGLPEDPLQLALARIRQLCAHEIGHTLGLRHNFAASSFRQGQDSGSVMDYPAPWVQWQESSPANLQNVYGIGIGAWDILAIQWLYQEFDNPAREKELLSELLDEGQANGLLFLSDSDARPASAAEARGNLWDNDRDPIQALENVLEVRREALARFGESRLAAGKPLATLQEVLAPLYFYHRYQLEATAKLLGGSYYEHRLATSAAQRSEPPIDSVPSSVQRQALTALLQALQPQALDLPETILKLLLPRPPGYSINREMFSGNTGSVFDRLGTAASAAYMCLNFLFEPHRMNRITDQYSRDRTALGLREFLHTLKQEIFFAFSRIEEGGRLREIAQVVQSATIVAWIESIESPVGHSPTKAILRAELLELAQELEDSKSGEEMSHRQYLVDVIRQYLTDSRFDIQEIFKVAAPPPGSPIGSSAWSVLNPPHAEIGCAWN